jgi:hypothetical protein
MVKTALGCNPYLIAASCLRASPSLTSDHATQERTLHNSPLGGEKSVRLIEHDTLANIKPSFKDDTNIVPTPPRESASSNCEKIVERDVEVYRKEAQSICMH